MVYSWNAIMRYRWREHETCKASVSAQDGKCDSQLTRKSNESDGIHDYNRDMFQNMKASPGDM
jgi:hypothetical protein